MSEKEIEVAYAKTLKTLGIATIVGVSVAYLMLFKNFQKALEKHQSMTELLYNPNARVAAGERAKQILLQLQAERNEEDSDDDEDAPKQPTLESLQSQYAPFKLQGTKSKNV